jgi:hypothetical protein
MKWAYAVNSLPIIIKNITVQNRCYTTKLKILKYEELHKNNHHMSNKLMVARRNTDSQLEYTISIINMNSEKFNNKLD